MRRERPRQAIGRLLCVRQQAEMPTDLLVVSRPADVDAGFPRANPGNRRDLRHIAAHVATPPDSLPAHRSSLPQLYDKRGTKQGIDKTVVQTGAVDQSGHSAGLGSRLTGRLRVTARSPTRIDRLVRTATVDRPPAARRRQSCPSTVGGIKSSGADAARRPSGTSRGA